MHIEDQPNSLHERMPPRLILYGVTVIGLIAALVIGELVGSSNALLLSAIIGGALALAWLVGAGRYWWLPFAFGIGIGGFFMIPFKVYPHEFALGVALLALIPQLVFSHGRGKEERPKLPLLFYLLGIYLLASFASCIIENRLDGFGNIARAYMNAFWPFVFGYCFWRFGSTTVLKAALRVIYVAALIRMGFGLINFFSGTVYIIPGINYAIDPQDLRASGSIVVVLAGLFLMMRGSMLARFFHGIILLCSTCAIFLGGSRTSVVQLLFLSLFALAVLRRWLTLIAAGLCASLLVLGLNAYPKALENLPYRVARGASILVLHEKLDVQADVRGSNEWHQVALPAEAYSRWSASPRTMLFGTGIKPFNPLAERIYFGRDFLYSMAKVSADAGAYESGFWTVLAVTGLVGLLLYLGLLLWLLKRLLPALLRRKKRDITWAVLFWGCYYITTWILFAIPAGGYPSFEIFAGLLALAALVDERSKKEVVPAEIQSQTDDHEPSRQTVPVR